MALWGWTVEGKSAALGKAIDKYIKKFNIDAGQLIRHVAIWTVKRVVENNPVDTGQSRGGWLPFLWANGITSELNRSDPRSEKSAKAIRRAQYQGNMLCRFRYDYNDVKPYAWVENNVAHTVFLEYGIRYSRFTRKPVSKRARPGFVRRALIEGRNEMMKRVRKGF